MQVLTLFTCLIWYNSIHLSIWYISIHLSIWYNSIHLSIRYNSGTAAPRLCDLLPLQPPPCCLCAAPNTGIFCVPRVCRGPLGKILSVHRTCHLELSSSLSVMYASSLPTFQVKNESPPLLFCLLSCFSEVVGKRVVYFCVCVNCFTICLMNNQQIN